MSNDEVLKSFRLLEKSKEDVEEVDMYVQSDNISDIKELHVRAIQLLTNNLCNMIDNELKEEGFTPERLDNADKMKKRIQRTVRMIGKR
ncbi:hypothetical protein P4644_16095 [Priestia aryabhattai]|uniref:hypothetical protein n=1 Tax=Priestia aryabhattai TaxID=412384 RepID=UPI002E1A86B8|nr:hypothetical protein [Priestia aryabhattai]